MFELDRQTLPFVIDEAPGANGKYVPGVGTEVIGFDDSRLKAVGLVLITAPSQVPELVARVQARLRPGVCVITTVPSTQMIGPSLSTN
jgi:hypothetical protein